MEETTKNEGIVAKQQRQGVSQTYRVIDVRGMDWKVVKMHWSGFKLGLGLWLLERASYRALHSVA